MEYVIKHVTSEPELDRALALERRVLAGSRHMELPEYSREKWLDRMKSHNDLMLFAEANGEVVAVVFGRVEGNDRIIVGPVATAPDFRRQGIAREITSLLEKRALKRGIHTLILGSVEDAEGFYMKCGFSPFLFVQTKPPHTLADLRALNVRYREVWSYDDGTDIRLMLDTNGIDRELQRSYETAFPGCSTQTVFIKRI